MKIAVEQPGHGFKLGDVVTRNRPIAGLYDPQYRAWRQINDEAKSAGVADVGSFQSWKNTCHHDLIGVVSKVDGDRIEISIAKDRYGIIKSEDTIEHAQTMKEIVEKMHKDMEAKILEGLHNSNIATAYDLPSLNNLAALMGKKNVYPTMPAKLFSTAEEHDVEYVESDVSWEDDDPICDCGEPGWACKCHEQDRKRERTLELIESKAKSTRKLDL